MVEFRINRVDDRGWYIVDTEKNYTYLHDDGIVRNGIRSNGFWGVKAEAQAFLVKWYIKEINRCECPFYKKAFLKSPDTS